MRARSAALLAAALLLAACSRDRDRDRDGGGRPASAESGAADEVRIETTDGGIDLALVGDTISAGLARRALEKARRETDSSTVKATGLGGSIERMVKSSVQSGLSTRVAFPVSAVKDIRYEDGAIRFEWNERPTRLFEQTKVNGRPFLESFRPEDAQRFVAAVRGRIRPVY